MEAFQSSWSFTLLIVLALTITKRIILILKGELFENLGIFDFFKCSFVDDFSHLKEVDIVKVLGEVESMSDQESCLIAE